MPKAMFCVTFLLQKAAGFWRKCMLPEQFNTGLKQFIYGLMQTITEPKQIIYGLRKTCAELRPFIYDSMQFTHELKQTMHELKQNMVLLQRKHKHLFPDLSGWERKGVSL